MLLRRLAVIVCIGLFAQAAAYEDERAASGVRVWVDPQTPADALVYTSSRGDKWELVMSDEFNSPNRTFSPGDDHMWTAMESHDGASDALEYYSRELATTECQNDIVCYMKLQAIRKPRTISVWNDSLTPPGMQSVTLYYQSAMVQSWNKFCFQGGMVEVRAQLPGAVNTKSRNPDLANGATSRVRTPAFYPTWPGVWLMGNLGRVLFPESMRRMWPFSYDACEPQVFDPLNQRISACNTDPGSGMNPKQGRGAPQINIVEGGGLKISSSLQISPGMPPKFRRIIGETSTCVYNSSCTTRGANIVGVPTDAYASRTHRSWYQGLRYAFNPLCANDGSLGTQSLDNIKASLSSGISANKCDYDKCPASFDINSDLSAIGPSSSKYGSHWGINPDGSCFAQMNPYHGAQVCNPTNKDPDCVTPATRAEAPPKNTSQDSFKYRMDAISANWPIHLAMYAEFVSYQVEWVPGRYGYIRWMLEGQPMFEIPAETVTKPPQDADKSNPSKILPQEPMYLIMNVALSSSWSAEPPNAGHECKSSGNASISNSTKSDELVCDQFPLDLKIDHIRVYQDVSSSSSMSVGCDPISHPTARWIEDHKREYENKLNPVVEVMGKAFCSSDADCTAKGEAAGACTLGRCICSVTDWQGPRCTTSSTAPKPRGPGSITDPTARFDGKDDNGGPEITLSVAGAVILVMLFSIIVIGRQVQRCTLYRKITPPSHNVQAMILTEPWRESCPRLDYQLTPIVESQRSDGSHYVRHHSTESSASSRHLVLEI